MSTNRVRQKARRSLVPTNADMVIAIKKALAETPIGSVSVRFADGRSVTYDRKQALEELAYWEKRLKAENSPTGPMEWGDTIFLGGNA